MSIHIESVAAVAPSAVGAPGVARLPSEVEASGARPFNNAVTVERLKELLSYDAETGQFRWLKASSKNIKIGMRAGSKNINGRRFLSIDGNRYQEHRLAWLYMTGKWPANFIDHINGVPDDNRFENLREATRAENRRNTLARGYRYNPKKNGTSNPYDAIIEISGKTVFLGLFPTEELAHAAYLQATQHYYGAFSIVNRLSSSTACPSAVDEPAQSFPDGRAALASGVDVMPTPDASSFRSFSHASTFAAAAESSIHEPSSLSKA